MLPGRHADQPPHMGATWNQLRDGGSATDLFDAIKLVLHAFYGGVLAVLDALCFEDLRKCPLPLSGYQAILLHLAHLRSGERSAPTSDKKEPEQRMWEPSATASRPCTRDGALRQRLAGSLAPACLSDGVMVTVACSTPHDVKLSTAWCLAPKSTVTAAAVPARSHLYHRTAVAVLVLASTTTSRTVDCTSSRHSEPPSYQLILTSDRRMSLHLLLAAVDFRLKIHIRFCRAYA